MVKSEYLIFWLKDIFLFSCYTGLCFADIINLTSKDISKGEDGNYWIDKKRKKTNKITSTFDSKEEVEADYPKEVVTDKKLPKVINENEEIETTDEIDNSRRKRRRSSANIE